MPMEVVTRGFYGRRSMRRSKRESVKSVMEVAYETGEPADKPLGAAADESVLERFGTNVFSMPSPGEAPPGEDS